MPDQDDFKIHLCTTDRNFEFSVLFHVRFHVLFHGDGFVFAEVVIASY